jgi:hypothetical protein
MYKNHEIKIIHIETRQFLLSNGEEIKVKLYGNLLAIICWSEKLYFLTKKSEYLVQV